MITFYDVVRKIHIRFKPIIDKEGNEVFIENFFDYDSKAFPTLDNALKYLDILTKEHEAILKESGDWNLLLNPQQIQVGTNYIYDIGNEVIEFYLEERELDIEECSRCNKLRFDDEDKSISIFED